MRTLLRVGGIAGMLAGALALALAPHAGITVAALIAVAGLAAGLATAKWLPGAWYGRQFGAGLRAGLIACVIAAPATLIALLEMAPQADAPVAIGSQSLAPLASLIGGPTSADALAVAGAVVAALVLAGFGARMFAGDKSARFVKAVARAREASQPLHEEGFFVPALARRTAVPLAAAAGAASPLLDRAPSAQPAASRMAPQRRTLAPATPPDGMSATNDATVSRRTAGPAIRRSLSPALHALPREPEPEPEPEPASISPPQKAPATPAPPPAPAAPVLKRRGGGRPPAARLTPAMIEALAAWARDTEEDDDDDRDAEGGEAVAAGRAGKGEEARAKREPVESSYLNTPAPAPKRKRKKNATRDWIC